jgi:hypothetical protein
MAGSKGTALALAALALAWIAAATGQGAQPHHRSRGAQAWRFWRQAWCGLSCRQP